MCGRPPLLSPPSFHRPFSLPAFRESFARPAASRNVSITRSRRNCSSSFTRVRISCAARYVLFDKLFVRREKFFFHHESFPSSISPDLFDCKRGERTENGSFSIFFESMDGIGKFFRGKIGILSFQLLRLENVTRERGKTFRKERRLKRKKKMAKREAILEERRLFQCLPPLNPLMTKYEHCRLLSCEISMLVFHA